MVKAFEEAAGQLGVEVRRARGSFRGGLCTVDGQQVIMLNKMHPPEAHMAILAESLRALPTDTIFLRPAVRHALEDLWAQHSMDVNITVDEDG